VVIVANLAPNLKESVSELSSLDVIFSVNIYVNVWFANINSVKLREFSLAPSAESSISFI
jgi:hypothetical protein